MQAHSGREDRRDRLRVGDQRLVLERQVRLGAVPVGHHERREVAPVADPGTSLEGQTRAVGRAAEVGVELEQPGLEDAQDGIGGNLDHSLGVAPGLSHEGVDVEKREDQDVELRREVLLGRIHLVDLEEVRDRNRGVPVASQLQVLDVHRLASRVAREADPERQRNLRSPCASASTPQIGNPDQWGTGGGASSARAPPAEIDNSKRPLARREGVGRDRNFLIVERSSGSCSHRCQGCLGSSPNAPMRHAGERMARAGARPHNSAERRATRLTARDPGARLWHSTGAFEGGSPCVASSVCC